MNLERGLNPSRYFRVNIIDSGTDHRAPLGFSQVLINFTKLYREQTWISLIKKETMLTSTNYSIMTLMGLTRLKM